MRNASKFLAILGVALVAVAVAAPVSANCIPAKIASTFSPTLDAYVYLDMGPGATAADTVGSFYAAGNPSANNGTYGSNEWLFVDAGGKLSMNANLGDARVNGCPAAKLVTRVQSNVGGVPRFITMTAVEGATGTSTQYGYWQGRPNASLLVAAPLPRPRVTNSGRTGNNINLALALDPTNTGNQGDSSGAVTGYEVVRASGSDPGNNAAGWTTVATVNAPGGTAATGNVVADCSNPGVDQFFATRLLFGDGQKSDIVSDPFRVNCNPSIAEPRFNVVPKQPTGPKKPGARQ